VQNLKGPLEVSSREPVSPVLKEEQDLMPKIAVVTDSTADLPANVYEENSIRVVPLHVRFGDETYREGVDLSSEEFYSKLASHKVMPRTSQPAPHEFEAVYRQLMDESDSIISIHMSSKLSGTYQSANIAADAIGTENIHVIDSNSVSAGTGLLALEAVRLSKLDTTVQEIVDKIEAIKTRLRLFFTVDTFEYMVKNGRIGKGTAFLGALLSIRPILAIANGEVEPIEKLRGSRDRALMRLAEVVADSMPKGRPLRGAVVHAVEPERGKAVKQALEELLPVEDLLTCSLGAGIGSHSGPGTIGVVLYPVPVG
jgi:DegV family protein with EDD domain